MNKILLSIILFSLLRCNIDSSFGQNLVSLHKYVMYKWEDQIIPESKIHLVLNDKNFIEKDWKKYISYKIKNERMENQNRIWMRIPLKDISKQYSEYLFIPNIIEIFEVYLDNKKIYSTGNVSKANGNMFHEFRWHLIKLPDVSSSKYIYIRNYSSNKEIIGLQYEVKIGLKEAIMYWILSRNKLEIIMGITLIILFPLIILAAFLLKPINKLDFYIFSFLSFFVGVHFINQLDSIQFVISDALPMIRVVVWEWSLIFIPITSILFYNSFFEKNKILNIVIIVFIFYILTKHIFMGFSFFNEWTSSLINLVVATYFLLGFFILKKAIKRDIDALLLCIGILFIAVSFLSELLNYDFQYVRMTRIRFSMFAFDLLCGFICFRKYIHLQKIEIEKKIQFEQNQKIKAELEYLNFKNKINRVVPHYLYNTLSYVLKNKSNEEMIEKSVNHLAEYYRNLVELSDGNNLTKIEFELNFTKEFLDFQKERFIKEFSYSIKKTPKLDEKKLIPLLSIQSLADNAYKHGIRNSKRKGKITIYLEDYRDGCKIIVEDNGIGLKSNFIKSRTLQNIEINAKLVYNEVSTKIENIYKKERKFGTRVELIFYSQKSNYTNYVKSYD